MRKIAVANRKGGTGKSTTAVHIAVALSLADYQVLLIDSDPQGQVARFFKFPSAEMVGLADIIEGRRSLEEFPVWFHPELALHVLWGGPELTKTARAIAREQSYKSPYMMKNALAPLEGKYDFVICDTAPGFNEVTVNVLFYVNELLIPVSMEALALDGFASFMREVEDLRASAHPDLQVKWIVPTFFDKRVRKSDEILGQLHQHFPELLTAPIPYSVKLSEAPSWKQTIFDYAPRDRGARAYAKLAGELI